MSTLEEHIATQEESNRNLERTAERIEKSIAKFINAAPKKYAGKWVEVLLISFIAGMMLYLFTMNQNQTQQDRAINKNTNEINNTK